MQAAPIASSEMLTVLKAEHAADRVQALGACEGMEGSGIASAEAFKVFQDGQKEGSDSKVSARTPCSLMRLDRRQLHAWTTGTARTRRTAR